MGSAVWSPTGSERSNNATLALGSAKLLRSERTPLEAGETPDLGLKAELSGGRTTTDSVTRTLVSSTMS